MLPKLINAPSLTKAVKVKIDQEPNEVRDAIIPVKMVYCLILVRLVWEHT